MKIEAVTSENLLHAISVYKDSWGVSSGVVRGEHSDDSCYADYFRKRMPNVYLLMDKGPVGIFCLDNGELSGLYIHSEFRRKGYGTHCVKYAKEHSAQLTIMVLSDNIAAQELYKKCGFHLREANDLIKIGVWKQDHME